jgi:uncharacterized membrane protein YgcG
VGAVVSAWEASSDFIEADTKIRAEAKILGTPRALSAGDKMAMRKAVETAYGKIPEKECPSNVYIASKLEDLEDGELVASPLDEIISRADGCSAQLDLASSLDVQGRLKVTKTKPKSKMPTSTEELRTKLAVEGNLWMMISSKFRNKSVLQGFTPRCMEDFTRYILGEKVLLLQVPDRASGGMGSLDPPWHLVLNYEYALRKEAFKRAMESPATVTIVEALQAVVKDSELKELFFISPLACSGKTPRSAPAAGSLVVEGALSKRQKKALAKAKPGGGGQGGQGGGKGQGGGQGGGRGSGKGAGRGAGRAGAKGAGKGTLAGETPDGRRICFAWNSGAECNGSCGMVHCCRIKGCFSTEHPMIRHGAAPAAG